MFLIACICVYPFVDAVFLERGTSYVTYLIPVLTQKHVIKTLIQVGSLKTISSSNNYTAVPQQYELRLTENPGDIVSVILKKNL